MSQPVPASPAPPAAFRELDHAKLLKPITVKGRALGSGLEGVIVYCHGAEAYEVEFFGLDDFFQIPADFLERLD